MNSRDYKNSPPPPIDWDTPLDQTTMPMNVEPEADSLLACLAVGVVILFGVIVILLIVKAMMA